MAGILLSGGIFVARSESSVAVVAVADAAKRRLDLAKLTAAILELAYGWVLQDKFRVWGLKKTGSTVVLNLESGVLWREENERKVFARSAESIAIF